MQPSNQGRVPEKFILSRGTSQPIRGKSFIVSLLSGTEFMFPIAAFNILAETHLRRQVSVCWGLLSIRDFVFSCPSFPHLKHRSQASQSLGAVLLLDTPPLLTFPCPSGLRSCLLPWLPASQFSLYTPSSRGRWHMKLRTDQ